MSSEFQQGIELDLEPPEASVRQHSAAPKPQESLRRDVTTRPESSRLLRDAVGHPAVRVKVAGDSDGHAEGDIAAPGVLAPALPTLPRLQRGSMAPNRARSR